MMKDLLTKFAISLAIWLVGTAHSHAVLNAPNVVLGRPTDSAITVQMIAGMIPRRPNDRHRNRNAAP